MPSEQTTEERPIARWVMREALCLSFYGTHWNDTSPFRRDICDKMAADTLAALAEVRMCVTELTQ